MSLPVHIYAFQPGYFANRSGMQLMAEYMGAKKYFYDVDINHLLKKHWTPKALMRRLGAWHTGSEWNSTYPFFHEWAFSRSLERRGPSIAHFLYGDFSVPMHPRLFRRRGARVIATYHASERRLNRVLGRVQTFCHADGITLMSSSQVPFFVEHGFPEERIRVILHGVDTDYFHPSSTPQKEVDGPLKCLLVGNTERDHAFASDVFRSLPDGVATLTVCTSSLHHSFYRNTRNVTIMGRIEDDELLRQYQGSDLLVMPMQDCTANNVFLESMACGTPVMTNRVGGVSDYMPEEYSVLIDQKNAKEWVDALVDLSENRSKLWMWRGPVRIHAESLAWPVVAARFQDFYQHVVDEFPKR